MNKKIAVSNQKGGVGKTTVAVNLGAGLAATGKRVLILDVDPQGNVSGHFDAESDHALVDLLLDGFQDCIIEVRPGLHILPSGRNRLYEAQRQLTRSDDGIGDFIEALGFLDAYKYDFILCDLSPTDTMLNRAALIWCDGILIPVSADLDAVVGAQRHVELIETEIDKLRSRRGREPLELFGVVLNLLDPTVVSKEIDELIREKWDGKVFKTGIRKNVSIKEARIGHQSIMEYDPKSHGAVDFQKLTREVLKHG